MEMKKGSFVTNETATLEITENRVEKRDDKWYIYSEDGTKRLGGPYDTREEAEKRLAQIERFKTNQFNYFTINLKADKAKVRYDTMEGRQYLVVPCVMMTEGVHEGSQGPLYYPAEELSKLPAIWNAKPVVVYHPEFNGQGISACDPIVFTKQKIGVLMNTKWEDGKLKTECWLEEDKVKEVDDRVLKAIESGKMMEVSTGLFTENEDIEGEWNGEAYKAIARNYKPDHLAILPDLKGACSIEDGAGLLRNSAKEDGPKGLLAKSLMNVFNELSHSEIWRELNSKIYTDNSVSAFVMEVFDNFFIYEKGDKTYYQEYSVNDDTKEVSLLGVRKEAEKMTQYKLSDGTLVGNAEMKTEGGSKYPAAAYAYVPDPDKPSTWKLRLWETPEKKETAAQVGRAIAAIGKGFRGQKVQLPADAIKAVKAKIRAAWRRTNPDKEASDMPPVLRNMSSYKENKMDKEKIVDGLIANEKAPWAEEDRDALMGMDDEKLAWIANQEKKEEKPNKKQIAVNADPIDANKVADEILGKLNPAAPVDNKDMTVEQYIANAPKEIQDVLKSATDAHKEQKDALIKTITANKRNPFTEEQLQAKEVAELKQLAAFAVEVKEKKVDNAMPGFFGGLGEVVDNTSSCDEEPLEMATMDFSK